MNPEKKELYTAKRSSGVDVSDPAISQAWSDLRTEGSPVSWMLMYLSAPQVVSVKSLGGGGPAEMISNMSDDEICFGAIRALVGGQMRYYYVYFTGDNVNGMKKGKASMYESGIFQALDGGHGKLQFAGMSETTEETIVQKIGLLAKTNEISFP
jgi:hypothetical protein